MLLWSNLGMGGGVAAVALTFRQALHAELLAIPGIVAIVGTSIYPAGWLPGTHDPAVSGPALTFAVEKYGIGFKDAAGHNLSGSDGTVMVRVKFGAWSYRFADADALNEILYDELEGLSNATWSGVQIVSCIHAFSTDTASAGLAPRTTLYQIESYYDIRYRIAIPVH